MRAIPFFSVLLLATAPLHAQETPAWQTDWNTAFNTAKEQHRLVFVDYFATWCGPCRTMEATVFQKPDIQQRLTDFVLLRVDFDRGTTARAHLVFALPTYAVYDAGERERFRMRGSMQAALFGGALDTLRGAAPSFVRVSEMLDSGDELKADFLLGNTYARVGLPENARATYERARKLAEKSGDKAKAQIAEIESAFTFAREKNPSRTIKLLQRLAASPVNQQNEAFLWLALGNAYVIAKDPNAARTAYQRAQSLATPDSATYNEANALLAKPQ